MSVRSSNNNISNNSNIKPVILSTVPAVPGGVLRTTITNSNPDNKIVMIGRSPLNTSSSSNLLTPPSKNKSQIGTIYRSQTNNPQQQNAIIVEKYNNPTIETSYLNPIMNQFSQMVDAQRDRTRNSVAHRQKLIADMSQTIRDLRKPINTENQGARRFYYSVDGGRSFL